MSLEPPIHQSRPQRDPNTTLLLRTLPRPLPFEFSLDRLWSFLSFGYVLLQHSFSLKSLSFESKVFILNTFNSIHQSIDNVSPGSSYSAILPAFWTCNTYFCSEPLSLPFPWSAFFFSHPLQPHICMVVSFFITQTSVQSITSRETTSLLWSPSRKSPPPCFISFWPYLPEIILFAYLFTYPWSIFSRP